MTRYAIRYSDFSRSDRARFWAKVWRRRSGCWRWKAFKLGNGYGRFNRIEGQPLYAHRVAWVLSNKKDLESTDTLLVCHSCDVRDCCNPEHLWRGSSKNNSEDMVAKRRGSFGERRPGAKLTDKGAREVIRLYATGRHMQKDLANAFGVSRATVCKLVNRKTWTRVLGEKC